MIRYYKSEICANGIAIESFKGPNGYFMIDKIKNYTSINKYDIQLLENIYNLLLKSNFKYLDKLKELLEKTKKMYSIYDEKSKYISNINLSASGEIEKLIEAAINKNDKIEIVYNDIDGGQSKRIIHPLHLFKYKDNNYVGSSFNNCNGIDDLFDKESGSIIIPMYEMELLQNSPLKDFWLSSENESLMYSLRDNNNFLLRGSKTYY